MFSRYSRETVEAPVGSIEGVINEVSTVLIPFVSQNC